MWFNFKIHSPAQLPKALLGQLEKNLTGINYPQGELLVLNYHSTPKKFIKNFEEQLNYYQKHFSIISPEEFFDFYTIETHKPSKPSLLLTFDDGLKNNLYAVDLLKKYNIKAFFFVVPSFVDTEITKQKAYYIEHIRPVINPLVDNQPEDFEAMNWTEIDQIQKQGHSIGAHTFTHTLVASQSETENSEKEIVLCKQIIESKTSSKISSFCSINNTLLSVGKKEKMLVEKNYDYHFTTIPGSNMLDKDPLFIRRRNVEVHWSTGAVYFAIGKWDLGRWANKETEYKNI